jgi:hypothetical protein
LVSETATISAARGIGVFKSKYATTQIHQITTHDAYQGN